MLLTFVFLISAAAAHPLSVHYDRRQDGELNISADLENILILLAIPEKTPSFDLSDFLKSKGHTRYNEAQERADHAMEAFVEPDTPYQVEITRDRSPGGSKGMEVVIAGRRRLETEPQNDDYSSEYKLIGATEQCGPERERDPVTLTCRFKSLDIADVKPAAASPNSIQKPDKDSSIQKLPAKDSLIQKEPAQDSLIQKEPAQDSSIQKELIKDSSAQKKPAKEGLIKKEAEKESQVKKELVKESLKSDKEGEKPSLVASPLSPEVVPS